MFENGKINGRLIGVGGALKCKADEMLIHGDDIPDAKSLFEVLAQNFIVKFFF